MKSKYPERIEKIKEMLLQLRKNYEIADALGVNRRTIYRDMKKWKKSGDYEAWLKQQFPRVYDLEKPRKAERNGRKR